MKWNKIHYTHLLTILIQVYGMKSKSENDISNFLNKKIVWSIYNNMFSFDLEMTNSYMGKIPY